MEIHFQNMDIGEAQRDFEYVLNICRQKHCEECELVGYAPLQLGEATMRCETGRSKKHTGGTDEQSE